MSKTDETNSDESKTEPQPQTEKADSEETEDSLTETTESQSSDNEFEKTLSNLSEKLDELLTLFNEKIQRDETKDSLFEILNSKLSKYERDFIFQNIKKRLFSDVILLFDGLEDFKKQAKEGTLDIQELGSLFNSLRQEILQMLKRQGVELIKADGNKFNEEYQEAINTKPVATKEEDQNIITVVRKGFVYEEKLLRPEEVIVGKYEPKKAEE